LETRLTIVPDSSELAPGSRPGASKPTSAYPKLLALTNQTVQARAARYRRLAVGVVVICAVIGVWTLLARQWHPLLALLILFPICVLFVEGDAALVDRWRHQVIDSWANGQIDLQAFRSAVEDTRSVPAATLRAMLDAVPSLDGKNSSGWNSLPARRALALMCRTLDACAANRRAANEIFVGLGLLCLIAWILTGQGSVFAAGALASLLAFPIAGVASARRRRDWRARLNDLRGCGLDLPHFVQVALHLSCPGIPSSHRDRLLASLR